MSTVNFVTFGAWGSSCTTCELLSSTHTFAEGLEMANGSLRELYHCSLTSHDYTVHHKFTIISHVHVL